MTGDRNEDGGNAGLLRLGGENAGRGHGCSDEDWLVAIIGGVIHDTWPSEMKMWRSNKLKLIKKNENENHNFRDLTIISML